MGWLDRRVPLTENVLTLLVLLRVLEVELSRSTLEECSCRPLALLPYIKKRQLRYISQSTLSWRQPGLLK